jgi:hypothetical protein
MGGNDPGREALGGGILGTQQQDDHEDGDDADTFHGKPARSET